MGKRTNATTCGYTVSNSETVQGIVGCRATASLGAAGFSKRTVGAGPTAAGFPRLLNYINLLFIGCGSLV